jgi:putative aminopeptidase FrvX
MCQGGESGDTIPAIALRARPLGVGSRMAFDPDLLEHLSLAAAPSGEERAVALLLRAAFEALGLRVTVDRVGHLWARIKGTEPGTPTSAVLAHMDEVGLVVRRVEPDGFLRVARLGGIGRRSLAARPVRVLGEHGPVPGILGVRAHHLTDPAQAQTIPPVEPTYVDVGAGSAAEVAALGIAVESRLVFDAPFRRLANGRISGKAMDNRVLCLALVELARRLAAVQAPGDVVLVGKVREEFNLRGALAAIAAIRPDFALVLDVTPAGDTPDLQGANDVRIGGGPAVKHYDFHGRGPLAGYIAPPGLAERLHACGAAIGVATQREAIVGLVTDAAEMKAQPNAPVVACLSVPTRYTHSPVELLALNDLVGLIALTEHALRTLPADAAVFAPPW